MNVNFREKRDCRMLRLPSVRDKFPQIADRAVKDQMTYSGFLAELLMAECDAFWPWLARDHARAPQGTVIDDAAPDEGCRRAPGA